MSVSAVNSQVSTEVEESSSWANIDWKAAGGSIFHAVQTCATVAFQRITIAYSNMKKMGKELLDFAANRFDESNNKLVGALKIVGAGCVFLPAAAIVGAGGLFGWHFTKQDAS